MNNQKLRKYIGLRGRELRDRANLTQQEVAEAIGLSRVSILNMESGRHSATYHSLFALCALYKCTPNDFYPPVKPCKIKVYKKVINVKKTVRGIKITR